MDEAVCNKLSLGFPLHFKHSELSACHQFSNLLSKLSQILSHELTLESRKALESSQRETRAARKKFLKEKVRLEAINEVIYSLPSSSHEAKLADQLQQSLVAAESQSYLNLGKIDGEQVTTLGLEVLQPTRPQNISPLISQSLYLIEEVLFAMCSRLLLMVCPDTESGSRKSILHPHILRLPDKVIDLVEGNKRSAAELREVGGMWEAACMQHVEVAQQTVQHLEQLICQFYTGSKLEANSISIQYLLAKCDTVVVKLKCLELDIVNSTYTRDTIRAIRVVRDRVRDQIAASRAALIALEISLHQYRAAGPEFSDIVKEYARVQKEKEGKVWALKELTDEN